MRDIHHDSLPPRAVSAPPDAARRPRPSLPPTPPEARRAAVECLEIARLLRQGFDAEALDALAPLRGRLPDLSAALPPPQRRLVQALLPLLPRLLRGGDGIGLADLLEHRLAPLLRGAPEAAGPHCPATSSRTG